MWFLYQHYFYRISCMYHSYRICVRISFFSCIYSSATGKHNTYLRLNRAPLDSVAKIYVTNGKFVVLQCTIIYDYG